MLQFSLEIEAQNLEVAVQKNIYLSDAIGLLALMVDDRNHVDVHPILQGPWASLDCDLSCLGGRRRVCLAQSRSWVETLAFDRRIFNSRSGLMVRSDEGNRSFDFWRWRA